MGIFEFLLGLIVFATVVSFGVTGLVGFAAWKGGKRLLGWARSKKQLPGSPQAPSSEAQDVEVEGVEDVDPRTGEPMRPARPATPAERAQAVREARQRRPQYVRLDPDAGATSGDVTKVMRAYVDDEATGTYAQGVIDTLDSAALHHQSLFAELDNTFQRGTMSWDKFAGPAYAALDAILRNSAHLANRIQSFDTAGYLRLKRAVGRDEQAGSNGGTNTRAERWQIFCEMLDSFDALQETNERLLLELDKLAAELGTLAASGHSGQGDSIIEEIQRLIEEAKYYR